MCLVKSVCAPDVAVLAPCGATSVAALNDQLWIAVGCGSAINATAVAESPASVRARLDAHSPRVVDSLQQHADVVLGEITIHSLARTLPPAVVVTMRTPPGTSRGYR
jgi:hypothetical protein